LKSIIGSLPDAMKVVKKQLEVEVHVELAKRKRARGDCKDTRR
jgi:hypothetical protein